MPRSSSHFAIRRGNRRGEWMTACGRSVREGSLVTLNQAEWIVCPECRKAALQAYKDFDAADQPRSNDLMPPSQVGR